MKYLPSLAGIAPPLQCNRVVEGSMVTPVNCGRPATRHVFWTPKGENGLCCDEHYDEARQKWVFWTAHEYRMECSMPGAWVTFDDDDESFCYVNEAELGLSVHTETEVSA